ncbi:MAG: TetR-like C-terminal domain-containing protein [Parabacteroides sp.]
MLDLNFATAKLGSEKVIQFYKHAYVGFILEWIRCGMEKDGLPSDKIAILLGDAIKHGILGIEEIVRSKNQ